MLQLCHARAEHPARQGLPSMKSREAPFDACSNVLQKQQRLIPAAQASRCNPENHANSSTALNRTGGIGAGTARARCGGQAKPVRLWWPHPRTGTCGRCAPRPGGSCGSPAGYPAHAPATQVKAACAYYRGRGKDFGSTPLAKWAFLLCRSSEDARAVRRHAAQSVLSMQH